jgi:hypothetical protein
VGGEIFRTCPARPWGSPSLQYNGYRVFPQGKERPGRDADPSPPSSAVGHERVELYLYSPYWPCLYRASVPVQVCTLPLPYSLLPYCYVQMYSLQGTANAVRSPGKAEDSPLPVTQFGWFLTMVQCLVSPPIRARRLLTHITPASARGHHPDSCGAPSNALCIAIRCS